MTWILAILLIVAGAGCVHFYKGREYWRRLAMAEAKKRLEKDSEQEKVRQAIDRAAAKMISAKDKEIADLQERLRYKTCVNGRLWSQLRDLKAGGDFDDLA